MARQIANYGDLKTKILTYLNKDNPEVENEVPTFIALAERKIFRQLRCPSNEKIVTYDPAGETITQLQLPGDYLEAILFPLPTNGKLRLDCPRKYRLDQWAAIE